MKLVTGQLLAIECKRAGGYQRPEQREFLEQVRAAGGLGIFATSSYEVRAALDRCVGSRASWPGSIRPSGPGRGQPFGSPQRPAAAPRGRARVSGLTGSGAWANVQ
jgi:hypothetical protein